MRNAPARRNLFRLVPRQYPGTLSGAIFTTPPEGWTCTAAACSNPRYNVAVVSNNAATPPSFVITATAIGQQLSDGDLTLNSLGQKTPGGKWECIMRPLRTPGIRNASALLSYCASGRGGFT